MDVRMVLRWGFTTKKLQYSLKWWNPLFLKSVQATLVLEILDPHQSQHHLIWHYCGIHAQLVRFLAERTDGFLEGVHADCRQVDARHRDTWDMELRVWQDIFLQKCVQIWYLFSSKWQFKENGVQLARKWKRKRKKEIPNMGYQSSRRVSIWSTAIVKSFVTLQ